MQHRHRDRGAFVIQLTDDPVHAVPGRDQAQVPAAPLVLLVGEHPVRVQDRQQVRADAADIAGVKGAGVPEQGLLHRVHLLDRQRRGQLVQGLQDHLDMLGADRPLRAGRGQTRAERFEPVPGQRDPRTQRPHLPDPTRSHTRGQIPQPGQQRPVDGARLRSASARASNSATSG